MAPEKRRRRGRGRGGNKRRRRRDMYIKMPDPIPERNYDPCPICNKAIKHVFSAITHAESGKPAHIECVVRELSERENLGEGERIAYIGRGCFAVVSKQPKVEEGRKRFNFVRRIEYEEGPENPEWRRELSPGISRDYQPDPKPLEEACSETQQTLAESLGKDRDSIYMPRLN